MIDWEAIILIGIMILVWVIIKILQAGEIVKKILDKEN